MTRRGDTGDHTWGPMHGERAFLLALQPGGVRCRVAGSSRSRRGASAALLLGLTAAARAAAPTPDAEAARRVLPQAEPADRGAAPSSTTSACASTATSPASTSPRRSSRSAGRPVPVVWFYHGSGSDHNALDGGFKPMLAAVVDRGGIAICQTAGGTLYSHPTAVALQVAGYAYMVRTLHDLSERPARDLGRRRPRDRDLRAHASSRTSRACTTSTRSYDIRAQYDQGGGEPGLDRRGLRRRPRRDRRGQPRAPPASAPGRDARCASSCRSPNESDTIVPPARPRAGASRARGPRRRGGDDAHPHERAQHARDSRCADFIDDDGALGRRRAPPPADTDTSLSVAFVAPANGATVSGTRPSPSRRPTTSASSTSASTSATPGWAPLTQQTRRDGAR